MTQLCIQDRGILRSAAKQGLNIPAAAQHAKNQHVFILDAVDDDILAHGKGPQAGAQIFVTGAAYVGMAREKRKSIRDGIDEPVGDVDTTAMGRYVIPNVIEVVIRLRRAAPYQWDVCRSAARRARPRRFTSSASSRMDSRLMMRPSPRARDASASSTAASVSARARSRSSHRERASFTASSSRRSRPPSIAWWTKAF